MTNVLLAEKWKGEDIVGWWMSEKLDGVRAYWNGKNFYSRLGNQFPAPPWFKQAMPTCALDGELWCGRKQFQRCVSIIKNARRGDDWKFVTYLVFDAPENKSKFEERLEFLKTTIKPSQSIAVVGMVKAEDAEHVKEELNKVEKLGGEGLMLRKPGSYYERRRSTTLLKVKSFFDEEAIVTGHQKGQGRNMDRMGALHCETPDGRKFKVGSGFNDSQRNKPPKIGSVITYRYQELSNGGHPRFPTFVGVRIDINWKEYCRTYKPPNSLGKAPPELKRTHTIMFSSATASPQKLPPITKDNDTRPACKFGDKCFRKSKEHQEAYSHPFRLGRTLSIADEMDVGGSSEDESAPAPLTASGGGGEGPSARQVGVGSQGDVGSAREQLAAILAGAAGGGGGGGKRKAEAVSSESNKQAKIKPPCRYGATCYREQGDHFEKYSHPPQVGRSLSSHSLRAPKDTVCAECKEEVLVARGQNIDEQLQRHLSTECLTVSPRQPAVKVYLTLPKENRHAIELVPGTTVVGRGMDGLMDQRLSRRQVEFTVTSNPLKVTAKLLGLNTTLLRRARLTNFVEMATGLEYALEHGDELAMLPDHKFNFLLSVV